MNLKQHSDELFFISLVVAPIGALAVCAIWRFGGIYIGMGLGAVILVGIFGKRGLVFVLIVVLLAFAIWKIGLFLTGVATGVVLFTGIFLNESAKKKKKKQQQLVNYLHAAKKLIQDHQTTLARKRKILLRSDDYGVVHPADWEKEKKYFLNNVVFQQLGILQPETPQEINLGQIVYEQLNNLIEAASKNEMEQMPKFDKSLIKSGEDYEIFCAELLASGGWNTRLTPTTGDQGVDIIAEKNGYRIAVQCKYVSSPVGNQAVQQVLAGKHFIGANAAVVVTNSSFTQSAQNLAAISDVMLIHHSELNNL